MIIIINNIGKMYLFTVSKYIHPYLNQTKRKKKNPFQILLFHRIFFLLLLVILICEFKPIKCKKEKNDKQENSIDKKSNEDKGELFITYSQFYEDIILYNVLKDIEKGFYIDVGASDPIKLSVTQAFYERGWNGINIEPLENEYKLLKRYRNRDININKCVGTKKGKIKLYQRGVASTIMENEFKKWKNKNKTSEIIVDITTMKQICNKYVPKGKIIDFFKVDVEGAEKEVLLGFNFKKYRPKIIVMESTLPGTSKPCHKEWEYILLNNGYEFAFQYKINRFYTDKNIIGLKNEFVSIEKIKEKYNIIKYN